MLTEQMPATDPLTSLLAFVRRLEQAADVLDGETDTPQAATPLTTEFVAYARYLRQALLPLLKARLNTDDDVESGHYGDLLALENNLARLDHFWLRATTDKAEIIATLDAHAEIMQEKILPLLYTRLSGDDIQALSQAALHR